MQVIYMNGIVAVLHTLIGAIFLILILTPQSIVLNRKVTSAKFPSIFKSSSSAAKLIDGISPITIDYENVFLCSKPSSLSNLSDHRWTAASFDGNGEYSTSKSVENALVDDDKFEQTKILLTCLMQKDKSKRDCFCFSHASTYFGLSSAILSITAGLVQIILFSLSFSYGQYNLKALYEYCAVGFSVFLTVLWLISGSFLWIFMDRKWPYEFEYNSTVHHFYTPPIMWKVAACMCLIFVIFSIVQVICAILFCDGKNGEVPNLPPPTPTSPSSEKANSQPKSRSRVRQQNDAAGSTVAAVATAADVIVVNDASGGGARCGQSAPIAVNFDKSANTMIFRSELKMECCHHSTSSSAAADDCGSKNLENKGGSVVGDQKFETPKKAATAAYYKMQNPFIRLRQNEEEYYDDQSMPHQSVIFANPSPNSVRIAKVATANDLDSIAAVESEFAESMQSTSASSETISAAAIPRKE